jgi:hypothetical protein
MLLKHSSSLANLISQRSVILKEMQQLAVIHLKQHPGDFTSHSWLCGETRNLGEECLSKTLLLQSLGHAGKRTRVECGLGGSGGRTDQPSGLRSVTRIGSVLVPSSTRWSGSGDLHGLLMVLRRTHHSSSSSLRWHLTTLELGWWDSSSLTRVALRRLSLHLHGWLTRSVPASLLDHLWREESWANSWWSHLSLWTCVEHWRTYKDLIMRATNQGTEVHRSLVLGAFG